MTDKIIYNPYIKNKVTFLESVFTFKGNSTILEIELEPAGGTNPEEILEDKIISVKTGRLNIVLNNESFTLFANQKIIVPKFSRYYIENRGPVPVVFRETINPGSLRQEAFLRINYGLATDGLTSKNCVPKNIMHSAVLNKINRSFVPKRKGLFSSTSFLSLVAYTAKLTGVEKSLFKKYVGAYSF